MNKILVSTLLAFSLHLHAAINTCDISIATQAYDENGYEKGAPIAKETIKKGATLDFKGASVDITIPWNAQEVKEAEPFTRHLESNHDDKSWADEDSRFLQKNNNSFLFIDGPGIHRSVYLISNCK